MIELLIAAAVISTGLFATANIVFSNLALSDRGADEVVAVNLAREGIEEAKELRDANWLVGNSFDSGMSGPGSDYSATPKWDGNPATTDISFDFTANDFTHPTTQVRQSTNLGTPTFYTQVDPAGVLTPWRRLITFHPICDAPGGFTYPNDGTDCGTNPKIGVRVESHAQWIRKNQTFNRTMYEDLFDWR